MADARQEKHIYGHDKYQRGRMKKIVMMAAFLAVTFSLGACDADVGDSCEDGVQCAAGGHCGRYSDRSLELTCLEICFKDEECEADEVCQGLGGTDVCRAKVN